MKILTAQALGVFVLLLPGTACLAQQTGDFESSPIIVNMINPGPGFSFDYAYAHIDVTNLNPNGDVYTLKFINSYGLDLSVFVSDVIPYWGPWKNWPFAPVGGTTSVSTEILIMNGSQENAVFKVQLLDKNGNELDYAWVYCASPN